MKQISGNPFKINSMKIRRVLWEPIINNGDHSVRATVLQNLGTETKMPHHLILGATTVGKRSVPFSSSIPFRKWLANVVLGTEPLIVKLALTFFTQNIVHNTFSLTVL
jgi:hypothetical protein